MAAGRPEELHRLWAESFNAGDRAGLASLYEPEARIVPRPDQEAVVGIQAVRAVLQDFLSQGGKIEIETRSAIQAGEIALLRSRWRFTGTKPDGTPIDATHSSSEVARRQPDGTWRYLIDQPFGAD